MNRVIIHIDDNDYNLSISNSTIWNISFEIVKLFPRIQKNWKRNKLIRKLLKIFSLISP